MVDFIGGGGGGRGGRGRGRGSFRFRDFGWCKWVVDGGPFPGRELVVEYHRGLEGESKRERERHLKGEEMALNLKMKINLGNFFTSTPNFD